MMVDLLPPLYVEREAFHCPIRRVMAVLFVRRFVSLLKKKKKTSWPRRKLSRSIKYPLRLHVSTRNYPLSPPLFAPQWSPSSLFPQKNLQRFSRRVGGSGSGRIREMCASSEAGNNRGELVGRDSIGISQSPLAAAREKDFSFPRREPGPPTYAPVPAGVCIWDTGSSPLDSSNIRSRGNVLYGE